MVQEFAKSNYLKLNYSKCKIVLFSRRLIIPSSPYVFEGTHIPVSEEGKYLAYRWKGDLLATWAIDENMRKACRAFFLFGSIGVFHGDLSPLNFLSFYTGDFCGSHFIVWIRELDDDWIIDEKAGEFSRGVGKRILKWPKHQLNTAAIVALVANNEMSDFITKTGFSPEIVKEWCSWSWCWSVACMCWWYSVCVFG